MKKKNPVYTYDCTRKLGSLIPLEVETKENTEKNVSQVIMDEVKLARGELSWTGKDIKVLRTAALCEVVHFYRALRVSLKEQQKEALLENLNINREEIALEIMKGFSVDEAFRKCCKELEF